MSLINAKYFRVSLPFLCWSVIVLGLVASACPAPAQAGADPKLKGAYTFDRGGWTYIHIEGTPEELGYQHGYLLAPQIEDTYKVLKLEFTHMTGRDWNFFRDTSKTMLWPHIDPEYQQELTGIAEGAKARGLSLDVYDIVAMNASMEIGEYYVPWLNKQTHVANAPPIKAPGHCSAFIATGSYTKGGKIVLAHNNWSSYADGSRWTVMFDIAPARGHRILMDGLPGVITSNDDFGENDAGIMIAETTIAQFVGWNSDGIPEFVRSRKALQYADSIDDYVATMRAGNNAGYANDWLIGDRKSGEIAYLELGLKNTPLWRSKDGYFVSANFPRDSKLIADETEGFDVKNLSSSMNARHVRWEQLIQANKGTIDAEAAERFLADHLDTFDHATHANERSLCGHVDSSPRGVPEWENKAYNPDGAVQGKVTDSDLAAKMSLIGRAGHPCGEDFLAKPFLAKHPEYQWQSPILRDMKAGPWTTFTSGEAK
jgi:hypothetical protein